MLRPPLTRGLVTAAGLALERARAALGHRLAGGAAALAELSLARLHREALRVRAARRPAR